MAQFEQMLDFTNKFSDNLFTQKSTFPQNTDFNVTAGTGTCSFFNDAYYGYFASVLCTSYKTTDFTFNFGDALTTPISKDGTYLFQLSIFDTDPTNEFFVPFVFGVNVFKNGVFDQTITGQMVGDASENSKKTITFSQNIECNSVTELDFTFTIDADVTYPFNNMNFNIGNFKIEHDNKFLGTPTPYSLPFDYYSANTDLHLVETQWDVEDIGAQVIANGASINLFTLIDNSTNKNTTNTDEYDELNIVSNSIITTYRNCKTIHTIRLSLNILSGSNHFINLLSTISKIFSTISNK